MRTRIAKPQGVQGRVHKGHELTDVRTGWIFGIVLFLVLAGAAIHLLMGNMLSGLEKRLPPTDPWRPAATVGPQAPAPFPRLQIAPPRDLEKFQAQEEAELHSYGWITRRQA